MKKLLFGLIIIVSATILIVQFVSARHNQPSEKPTDDQTEQSDALTDNQINQEISNNQQEPTPEEKDSAINENAVRTKNIEYTVQAGDVLGLIAQKFDLSISTILSANNLTATSVLQPGDTLIILPFDGIEYTVKSGDTLSKIANYYGIEAEDIVEKNNLSSESLQIGQTFILPGAVTTTYTVTAKPISSTTKPTTNTAPPKTTTTTTSPQTSGTVTWTAGALGELNKIPSLMRSSVKAKYNAYAKSHGITTITREVYLSIQI